MLIKLVDHLLSVRFGPDVIEAFSPKHEGKNYERALFLKAATLKLFVVVLFANFYIIKETDKWINKITKITKIT